MLTHPTCTKDIISFSVVSIKRYFIYRAQQQIIHPRIFMYAVATVPSTRHHKNATNVTGRHTEVRSGLVSGNRSVYIPLFPFSIFNEKWKMENEQPFFIFHFRWKMKNEKWKIGIDFPFSIFHCKLKMKYEYSFSIFNFSLIHDFALFICKINWPSSSAMAERPRELDQRFQMGGGQFEAIID